MLQEGDILSLEDGREIPIQNVKVVNYNYNINVYNFEVKDFHTYYVSDYSVLVHNSCAADNINQIIDYIDNFNENTINHIINGSYKNGHNHHWELLSPNKDWQEIRSIIIQVMKNGKETHKESGKTKNLFMKTATIKGQTVQVKYIRRNGMIQVSDAWILK